MEKRTPQDVLKFAKDKGARVLDLKFVDLPGTWQHFSLPIGALEARLVRRRLRLRRLQHPRLGSINESDMLLIPDPNTAFMDPFMKEPDALADLQHHRSHHQAALRARSALDREEGRGVREEHRRSPPTSTSAPKPSSSSSTTSVSTRSRTRLLLHRLRRKGAGTPAATKSQSRLPAALQGRLLPGSAHRSLQDLRTEMMLEIMKPRHRVEPPPRSRHRRPVRDRSEVRHAGQHGGPTTWSYKYVIRNVAQPLRQDGDVHAEAASSATTAAACTATRACGRAASRCSRATSTRA